MTGRWPAGRATLLVILGCLGLAAAGCTPVATSAAPASAPASAVAPSSASPTLPWHAPSPWSSPHPGASRRPSASVAPVGVDRTLLDVLPSEVDGIPVAFDEAASAEFAAESGSSGRTESVAYAVAADPARRDLVVAAVSRLRAGVFEEGLFRDWRDTYDREVCAAAGGVHGNAEAEIGTRTVYIGSCADGSRTYHAWLPGRRAIVSVFSAGERQLGERLVSGLQEPTR